VTFAAPYWLLGLFVVAAAIAVYVLNARGRAPRRAAFASAPLAAAVTPRTPGFRRHVAPLLYAIAGAALVIALARPQATVAVPIEQATVVLVTDHSRSMTATDVKPNRMKAAAAAADQFLDDVPDDLRVGAVLFNHRPQLVQVPVTDRKLIRDAFDNVQAQGGTAIGEGLALGLAAARQPVRRGEKPPPAAIILMSDGRSTNGREPSEIAEAAKKAGIPVHTVALGSGAGALPAGGTATADQETLRQIALTTGGRFYTAEDAEQLKDVYKELGSRVATRDERREVTAAAVGGGLLLLLAGGAFSLTTFGRLP
jgi:Ca-activated chloride channel family protein